MVEGGDIAGPDQFRSSFRERTLENRGVTLFPEGRVLLEEEAIPVVLNSSARVVVIAGDAESGKTTLLAELYDWFQTGAVHDYAFGGSLTLPGFEERCHLSRIASGGAAPDTPRTGLSTDLQFLHLRIVEKQSEVTRDVLFTDLHGEVFRTIADSSDHCRGFGVLRRADHVTVLVDGARLIDRHERQRAFLVPDSLIQRCLDCGMLGEESRVQVVTTKWDIVASAESTVARFVSAKEAWLRERYERRVASIEFHRTCVRPVASPNIEHGFGLNGLMNCWFQHSRCRGVVSRRAPAVRDFASEFDRFGNTEHRVTEAHGGIYA